MDKRATKRHTIEFVATYCGLVPSIIRSYEHHTYRHLDFLTWCALATYYGKDMLTTPFTVHKLEFPVAEIYFMHIRNGEPVQYAAQQAHKMFREE